MRFTVALEEIAAVERLRADQAAEREARKQVRGRHADPRRRRVQALFRRADIRTTTQQLAGRACVDRLGQRRQRRRTFELCQQCAGRLARQDREPVHRDVDGRRKRRDP